jgi:hypothetical protein
VLKASIQGLVIHGAAHFARDAPSVWDIVPDADGIVVVIESIGHRAEKLLSLFSPFPIHVLQACIEHQPPLGGQPEGGAIRAGDLLRFLLTAISFGFELINPLVKRFNENQERFQARKRGQLIAALIETFIEAAVLS